MQNSLTEFSLTIKKIALSYQFFTLVLYFSFCVLCPVGLV